MSIKKHIPNILSTIRLVMAFSLPFIFLNTSLLNTLIFYLAGDATDAVDGFLARKWKVQSKYGKLVDPVADKMLNGLTLLLTSILVNPLLFVLTGFEALIAATNIARIKKKKEINVAIIGKVKTVSLFFTIVSSLLAPIVPAAAVISNTLIALTAVLQTFTAGKYLREYYREIKAEKSAIPLIEPEKDKTNNIEEIEKLKYAKSKMNIIAFKEKTLANPTKVNELPSVEPVIEEDSKENNEENLGISRTLRP